MSFIWTFEFAMKPPSQQNCSVYPRPNWPHCWCSADLKLSRWNVSNLNVLSIPCQKHGQFLVVSGVSTQSCLTSLASPQKMAGVTLDRWQLQKFNSSVEEVLRPEPQEEMTRGQGSSSTKLVTEVAWFARLFVGPQKPEEKKKHKKQYILYSNSSVPVNFCSPSESVPLPGPNCQLRSERIGVIRPVTCSSGRLVDRFLSWGRNKTTQIRPSWSFGLLKKHNKKRQKSTPKTFLIFFLYICFPKGALFFPLIVRC